MDTKSFAALRYQYLLQEIRQVLANRGAWQAMPALMDELNRLRHTALAQHHAGCGA